MTGIGASQKEEDPSRLFYRICSYEKKFLLLLDCALDEENEFSLSKCPVARCICPVSIFQLGFSFSLWRTENPNEGEKQETDECGN